MSLGCCVFYLIKENLGILDCAMYFFLMLNMISGNCLKNWSVKFIKMVLFEEEETALFAISHTSACQVTHCQASVSSS